MVFLNNLCDENKCSGRSCQRSCQRQIRLWRDRSA
ncbi:MAG TPA: hypothetical protein ENH82_11520 [bacterium]|nr:hypothetical protein [bacterium]